MISSYLLSLGAYRKKRVFLQGFRHVNSGFSLWFHFGAAGKSLFHLHGFVASWFSCLGSSQGYLFGPGGYFGTKFFFDMSYIVCPVGVLAHT